MSLTKNLMLKKKYLCYLRHSILSIEEKVSMKPPSFHSFILHPCPPFPSTEFYERVTMLKAKGVKVLIAIGGWNDSLGGKYSRLVNSAAARKKFIDHVIQFILKHNFDGLDLDWEYPVCWQVRRFCLFVSQNTRLYTHTKSKLINDTNYYVYLVLKLVN